MTHGIQSNPEEQGRQAQLDAWLDDEGASYAKIGKALGVSRHAAIKILRRDAVDPGRFKDLRALRVNGKPIPRRLLPKEKKAKAVVELIRESVA